MTIEYYRHCSGCGRGMNEGYLCCDEYYCSDRCLDRSFEGTGETWRDHYSDDGDCYWTEWTADDAWDEELAQEVAA